MDLTIYTYGHIDAMFYIVNGIAMIMNSPFAEMMINTISMVSTCYYAFKAAYASSSGGGRHMLLKVAGMVITVNSLLIPKTSIIIEDHITKQRDKVDNLPYGFAIPVGFMENFGNVLTASFEQAFTMVASTNYRDYGMVFGARLIHEARNWKIQTPEFVHNMDNFIRRCVVIDSSIGNKYTINDLFESDNILKLVSANVSKLRRVEIRLGKTHELVTCKDAIDNILMPAFMTELDKINAQYKNTEFGLADNIKRLFSPRGVYNLNSFFKKNIEIAFEQYLGRGNSAEENLKQYMMLNSLSDYGKTYGYARASMTQDANWQIAGDLASTYLPILLSVIKGFIYASFVFMIPIILLSGGISKYLSYIAVVMSVQLWPALNSILNMFIDLYSASTFHGIAIGGVNFTNYNMLGNYANKITVVASGLQMMIPFLAFNIIQGGVGGFIHLAGNIMAASNAASSNVANEVTTGNKSFDNYSSGNMQIAMQQGFKTDWNQSYKEGAREYQHMDGNIERILQTGQSVVQSGAGITISGGSVRFNLRNEEAEHLSDSISSNKNILETYQRAFHEANRSTEVKAANWLTQLAKRDQAGASMQYEKLGEQSQSVQKAVNFTQSLSKQNGYSIDRAAQILVRGASSLSFPSYVVGGSVGLDGTLSRTQNSSESVMDGQQLNLDQFTHEDYNNIIKVAMNQDFAVSRSIDKSYSEDVRHSYEKQQDVTKSVQIQSDKLDSLGRALAMVQSMEGSYDRDMYHEVQKSVVAIYGVSEVEAHRMIENHDPRVTQIWSQIKSKEMDLLFSQEMKAKQFDFTDKEIGQKLAQAESRFMKKLKTDYMKDVKSQYVKAGLEMDDLNFSKSNIMEIAYDIMTENSNKYIATKKENEDTGAQIKGQGNKNKK